MKKIFAITKSYCYNPLIVGESASEWSMLFIRDGECRAKTLIPEDAKEKIQSNNMVCVQRWINRFKLTPLDRIKLTPCAGSKRSLSAEAK